MAGKLQILRLIAARRLLLSARLARKYLRAHVPPSRVCFLFPGWLRLDGKPRIQLERAFRIG